MVDLSLSDSSLQCQQILTTTPLPTPLGPLVGGKTPPASPNHSAQGRWSVNQPWCYLRASGEVKVGSSSEKKVGDLWITSSHRDIWDSIVTLGLQTASPQSDNGEKMRPSKREQGKRKQQWTEGIEKGKKAINTESELGTWKDRLEHREEEKDPTLPPAKLRWHTRKGQIHPSQQAWQGHFPGQVPHRHSPWKTRSPAPSQSIRLGFVGNVKSWWLRKRPLQLNVPAI